ncbi:MAG TPA: hypothetical protein VEA59_03005 [Patescibacteria group bacterium]|nr:hypothetical protein [Patescibacteria group bacterium]
MKTKEKNKILALCIGVFSVIFSSAFAQSSASYNAVGSQFAPAVGAASSSSFIATSVLVAMPSGAPASPSYQAVVGSPILTGSPTSTPTTPTTPTSGGGFPPGGFGGSSTGNNTSSSSSSSASSSGGGDQKGSDGVSYGDQQVYNVQVVFLSTTSATIAFETLYPALTSVTFVPERQQEVKAAVKATQPTKTLSTTHTHVLRNLTPNTTHLFTLFVQNPDRTNILFQNATYNFTTKERSAAVPAEKRAPVTTFEASRIAADRVILSWHTGDKDIVSVKIFRSETNFPKIPGGTQVYEGKDQAFTDTVPDDKGYYYTLFPVYADGTVGIGIPAKAPAFGSGTASPTPQITEQKRILQPTSKPFNWIPWILGFNFLLLITIFIVFYSRREKKKS